MDISFAEVFSKPILLDQGKIFLPPHLLPGLLGQGFPRAGHGGYDWSKEGLEYDSFSCNTSAGWPFHSVANMHFPFCYWRIWRNPSCIPWHPRARFNSKLVLVSSWPVCTLWPHSYIHPCFHLACISCLCLNFESSSLFIHAGLLLLLPNFSLIGMHHF